MYNIVKVRELNQQVKLMEVEAPLVARKAQPGQFIILRIDEKGERIPLTIHDTNLDTGTVTIIFQEVGKTTRELGSLIAGDFLLDFVGPLGVPTELDGYQRVVLIAGGLGAAIAYSQAKKLRTLGTYVHIIMGARNKDLIILKDEMQEVSNALSLITDDGSSGRKGLVTNVLKDLMDEGDKFDLAIVIGPLIMMKVVSKLTEEYGIKTIVSMNPIMIDGTGMCGGCRVTVGGKVKFACVDGPDFDGHLVDFDEAMRRQPMYKSEENVSNETHICKLADKHV